MTTNPDTPPAKAEKPATKTAEKPDTKKAEKPAATEGSAPDTPKDPAAGYTRGEGQKPVSPRYRSNWDTIFAKRKR